MVNGGTPTADTENWDGEVSWATPVDLGKCNGGYLESTIRTLTPLGLRTGSAAVSADSLVVSTRAPIGYVAQTTRPTAFNQGCRGLVSKVPLDTRFYRYALLSLIDALQSNGQGSTFTELSTESLAGIRVPNPSLGRQRAIADFLDAETARIDSLAERKQKIVELIGERHALVVREACLLEPSGQLRAQSPLRRRWTVTDCKHRTPSYLESGYPVVSPGDVTSGTLDLKRCHRFVGESDFQDLTDGRLAKAGDIIYSRNASIGIASYVSTNEPFTMGQDVCLIRSKDQDQRFLTAVLNSFGIDQLEEMKVGSTFSRVNISQILDLRIPDADPQEQTHIASRLERLEEHHGRLVVRLDRSIDLLKERKQALITAAVTGQLDLARGIAEEAS